MLGRRDVSIIIAFLYTIISTSQAGHLVSRLAHNHERPGSIPGPATNTQSGNSVSS
ncbi:conserved hypothetical protein [Sinorhizobium medicae]|uniref:Uncharacterized protein n=1 Tax=Sinorhizobium medicae TaxID=110321 RepID=A0A508WVJ9_9HYPH|nr:conserved hypothetical protein [Sinorhizobium medicae]